MDLALVFQSLCILAFTILGTYLAYEGFAKYVPHLNRGAREHIQYWDYAEIAGMYLTQLIIAVLGLALLFVAWNLYETRFAEFAEAGIFGYVHIAIQPLGFIAIFIALVHQHNKAVGYHFAETETPEPAS